MSAAPPLVGCALHDGADIDACGCPALDSPGAIAYRGLLVKARAEIARLRALGLEACDRLDAVARGARGRDAEEARATADRIRKELTRG